MHRITNDPFELAAVMSECGAAPEVVIEATYGWYWVVDLLQELGATVLFVTHDLEEAIAMSDRVLLFTAGPAARIKGDYRIDLPRPRNVAETSFARGFVELYQRVWADLREEVMQSHERSRTTGSAGAGTCRATFTSGIAKDSFITSAATTTSSFAEGSTSLDRSWKACWPSILLFPRSPSSLRRTSCAEWSPRRLWLFALHILLPRR